MTLTVFTVFVFHYGIYGQVGTGLENSLGITEGNLRNGTGLRPINTESYKTYIGSSLLFENNKRGYIKFRKSDSSKEFMLNIDLLGNFLNVYTDSDISIPLIHIDTIYMYEGLVKEKFVPVIIEDQELCGKILISDEFDVIKVYSIKLQKPNYNVALDQGSSLPKIIRSENYYILSGGEYIKLPSKSKKLNKIKQIDKRLKKFATSKSRSLNSDADVIAFFGDYFKTIN